MICTDQKLLQGKVLEFGEKAEEQVRESKQQQPLSTAAIQALCQPLACEKLSVNQTEQTVKEAAAYNNSHGLSVMPCDVIAEKSAISSVRDTVYHAAVSVTGSSGDVIPNKQYQDFLQNFCQHIMIGNCKGRRIVGQKCAPKMDGRWAPGGCRHCYKSCGN